MWRLFWADAAPIGDQGEPVGSGNTESLVRSLFTRQSILLYALKTHAWNRRRFAIDTEFLGKDKTVVRLTSAREVERFLASA